MKIWSKLRSLSLDDYYLLLWASIMLPVVGCRLRLQGFKRVYSQANGQSFRHPSVLANATGRSVHLGKVVNLVAAKGLYRANCLCRSSVLLRMMQREGIVGELRIGIPEKPDGRPFSILDAHAWVEYQGVVINDHEDVASKHAVFHSS